MNHLILNADLKGPRINRNLYGHFSEHLGRCIYGGIWVGKDSPIPNTDGMRNDVLQALRDLQVPVLRWPGGCFADEYHWRDGVGPYETRKRMINTHWGGVVENNHFGTHEFLRLCELIGAEPYICGNGGERYRAGNAGMGGVHHLRRGIPDDQPAQGKRTRRTLEAHLFRRGQ